MMKILVGDGENVNTETTSTVLDLPFPATGHQDEKMKLDMVGAPSVRTISGTLCGPNLKQILDNIAKKGEGMDDDEED